MKTVVDSILEYEDLRILLLLTNSNDPDDISHLYNHYIKSRPEGENIQERVKQLTIVIKDCMPPIYKDILDKLLILI